jgi:uncharacterized membrane protein
MNKNRLENFSDGVFAIAVTLLILDVRIPVDLHKFTNRDLNGMLWHLLPRLVSFAFSFLVIGMFWVAHHRIFSFVRVPNNTLLWLNILYLLFVAIIPVTSSLISENPFLTSSVLFYTINLFVIAIMHLILLEYILNHRTLKHEALTKDIYRSALRTAIVGPVCYVLAAAASFISGYISLGFIIGAVLFYIFFSGRSKVEEKMVSVARKEVMTP